jgi:hypothetical protein
MTGISLKELARLSQDLNQASDALSQQIAQVEEALNELKLGVRAWVQVRSSQSFDEGSSYPTTDSEYLGYGKRHGRWGLLYMYSVEEFPDRDSVMFLRDAPREDRVTAVEKLAELVRALEKTTKELTEEATKKAAQVADFAAALKQ